MENHSDSYYKLFEKINHAIHEDTTTFPLEIKQEELPNDKVINSFHATFLSNFYVCTVLYEGIAFATVEHAYQGAKFHFEKIDAIKPDHLLLIQEFLNQKGYGEKFTFPALLFKSQTISAGMIKRIAEILRECVYQRNGWNDELRLQAMIPLLLQKFSQPHFAKLLLATDAKVLIEGNDWDDTFWGVSKGNGKNMLGKILMDIRSRLQSKELEILF